MVLKEAFRNQNYLEEMINKALTFLSRTDNIITKTQEHMKKASNPDAVNEEVKVPKLVEVTYTPNDVVNFVMNVIGEKEKLTDAIYVAKSSCADDIDSCIAMNKTKQNVIRILKTMAEIKSGEKVSKAYGQKFDINGVPVNYSYDVKETTVIDFDRNKVKAIAKKLTKETDDISTQIDKVNVTLEVAYEPVYEIGDSLDDCIEKFLTM